MRFHFVLLLLLATLLVACATPAPPPAATTSTATTGVDDSMQWEADIAAFEQADSVVRRRPGGVVFVGSSSIRMWQTMADDFPGVATINRGFGGSRVRDSTYYADRIVTAYQPRAVVFYAGDNDLFEGRTPRQVRDDFAAFVARVHLASPDARIAFVAIKPSPSRLALLPQMREANRLVQAFAEREPLVDYLDVYTPMLDANAMPRAGLFLGDQLHMNRAGYALWVRVVAPWLGAL